MGITIQSEYINLLCHSKTFLFSHVPSEKGMKRARPYISTSQCRTSLEYSLINLGQEQHIGVSSRLNTTLF